MNKVVKGEGYLVFDDFLHQDELLAIQLYLQFENYFLVHSQGWSKSWRMNDGEPLASMSYMYSLLTEKTTLNDNVILQGIHILSVKISTISARLRDFLGADWNAFSLTTFLYPAGSGLGWHEDDGQYKGAYIFYAHPQWKPDWGGELFITHQSVNPSAGLPEQIYQASEEVLRMSGITGGAVGPEFGWTLRERKIFDEGIGTFISPKPNRLVIVKPEYSHCIKKVDVSAGDNPRCSIAGFFHEN